MSDKNDELDALAAAADEPQPAPDPAAEDAPDGETPPNAVLIVRFEDEHGNIGTDTRPLGDVKATEVQTVIELGLAQWRAKIGLVHG